MRIQFSKTIIFIPNWVIIALVLIIPSWIFSRWGLKKGTLKFLMFWSLLKFVCLGGYVFFSRDPFAIFGIFHVLVFGLLSLIFYSRWKSLGNDGKRKKKTTWELKQLKFINIEWQ